MPTEQNDSKTEAKDKTPPERTHDPKSITEDLRNHLASHNRPIIFLFGAGTSCSVNIAPEPDPGKKREYRPLIPAVASLTEQCKAAAKNLGPQFENAWRQLESQCLSSRQAANIENILSRVQSKLDAIGDGEKLVGLDRNELNRLEENIRKTIAGAVNPEEKRIPEGLPHGEFARWIKMANRNAPLEIFTTNYDILFERAFEEVEVPYFDGFAGSYEPFFYEDAIEHPNLLPKQQWIRFWKVHGSVNWKLVTRASRTRVVRSLPGTTGEMILPSHRKYDQSRKQPYTALMDRLSRVLNQEHALLITCGYSFGDEHINSIIFTALDNCPTTHVFSLQFEDILPDSPLMNWAKDRRNLAVLGRDRGVIGGVSGRWKLLNPVDHKTHSFMDVAFDSYAAPEAEGTHDQHMGSMRLGDFNWFCKFLSTMGHQEGPRA